MAQLTRSVVVRAAGGVPGLPRATNSLREAMKAFGKPFASVFLSHSHKDSELIDGLITLLAGQGIDVYVDWKDAEMPAETSPETAARLKEKIQVNDRFIVVLTENSRSSVWVPWELGAADRAKGIQRVAIWPVAEDGKGLSGIEFMGVYPRIETFDGLMCLIEPNWRFTRVDHWLRA